LEDKFNSKISLRLQKEEDISEFNLISDILKYFKLVQPWVK
jgi:hypothetical protein